MKQGPGDPGEKGAMLTPAGAEKDTYPHGPMLCSGSKQLDKPGITEPPAVGAGMRISVIAEVVGIGQGREMGGGVCRNARPQITNMDPPAPAATPIEERLYRRPGG